jgi:hypothetical protein
MQLVRGQGVEPRFKASKASVLPLDDPRANVKQEKDRRGAYPLMD